MQPQILVVYFSQTGQLRQILDNLVAPLQKDCIVDFVEINPATPFPFPWTAPVFFDCMPECVLQIPEPLLPVRIEDKPYDLVILGYQPWFLSPSIPFNSFLQSPEANFLKGKRVLTVIGSRNMWLNAQEKTKERLSELGAVLVGNIVLFDRSPNLISVLTITRWTFTGRKEATRWMPEAGIQQRDIEASAKYGLTLLRTLQNGEWKCLQQSLLAQGAIELNPALVILETRGIANFRKFAPFIREKGERGNSNRLARVKLFQRLLMLGIFVLSPISSLTAQLILLFKSKSIKKDVAYFKNIEYRKNAI